MSLARVEITSDVFWTCVTHALTTETEEIMGLLLGDTKEGPNGEQIVRIWFAMPQIRTDRRKDRVEASPEQMVRCAAQAEEYSKQRGVRIRVIGWYHSHPHITVLPSHVDVRTQATYQQLDECFVGLIFSTFNEDGATLSQRVQVTAFQSVEGGQEPAYAATHDEGDYDAAMAAAIAASQCEHSGGGSGNWVRREVPLAVVQTEQAAERSDNLFGLMRVLFREEQAAFRRAITHSSDTNGTIHPLASIHYGATYQQHMCQLIELVLGPTVQALENYKTQVHLQVQRLRALETELQGKLADAAAAAAAMPAKLPRRMSQPPLAGSVLPPGVAGSGGGGAPLSASAMDPQPSMGAAHSYGLPESMNAAGSGGAFAAAAAAAAGAAAVGAATSVPAPTRGSDGGGSGGGSAGRAAPSDSSSERVRDLKERLERLKVSASMPADRGGAPALAETRVASMPAGLPEGDDKSPFNMGGGGGIRADPALGQWREQSAAAHHAPVAAGNPAYGEDGVAHVGRRVMAAADSRPHSGSTNDDALALAIAPGGGGSALDAGMVNPLAQGLDDADDDAVSIDSERPGAGAEEGKRRRDKLLGGMVKAGGGMMKAGKGLASKLTKGHKDTPPDSPARGDTPGEEGPKSQKSKRIGKLF